MCMGMHCCYEDSLGECHLPLHAQCPCDNDDECFPEDNYDEEEIYDEDHLDMDIRYHACTRHLQAGEYF